MGEIRMTVKRLRRIAGRWFWCPTPAVRRLGFASEPLGAEIGPAIARAEALNRQVDDARNGIDRQNARTMRALIRLYRADPLFDRLAPRTRVVYGSILNEIERLEGQNRVEDYGRAEVRAIYRNVSTRGLATANAHMRMWRRLMAYAIDEGWIVENPAARMRLAGVPSRRQRWTPAEIADFIKACDAAGRASVGTAVLLAYDLGQRQEDVLRLSWADWDGQAAVIRQGKTGEAVRVPGSKALKARLTRVIEAGRTSTCIVVAEATGKPYKGDYFRHEFMRLRALSGIRGELQFRDLRRTAATELGDAGATDDQIRAVTGHKSRSVVAVYVRPTDTQARAAQQKRARSMAGSRKTDGKKS